LILGGALIFAIALALLLTYEYRSRKMRPDGWQGDFLDPEGTWPFKQAMTPCRLCGATSSLVLATRCRGGEQLETVLCDQCGLVRRDPLPSLEDLRQYYKAVYRVETGKGRIPSKRRLWRISQAGLERALDLLPRLPEAARTLDLGCGAGELVYLLRAARCDAHGFDPDSRYIDWAYRIIGDAVEENTIENFVPSRNFDAIFMYHVLEHMPDPRYVFSRCSEWLTVGGLLVIEVPNVEARNQAPGHQYIKPHLHYFNKTTLTVLASQNGFTLEHGDTYNNDENLRCYFRKRARTERFESRQPENADRIHALLAAHDWLSHYTSTIPYARLWSRFSRSIMETLRTLGRTHASILAETAGELRVRMNVLEKPSTRLIR